MVCTRQGLAVCTRHVWLKNSSNRHRRAWGIELQPQNEKKNEEIPNEKKKSDKKSRPVARQISFFLNWQQVSYLRFLKRALSLKRTASRVAISRKNFTSFIELPLRIQHFRFLQFPHLGSFYGTNWLQCIFPSNCGFSKSFQITKTCLNCLFQITPRSNFLDILNFPSNHLSIPWIRSTNFLFEQSIEKILNLYLKLPTFFNYPTNASDVLFCHLKHHELKQTKNKRIRRKRRGRRERTEMSHSKAIE